MATLTSEPLPIANSTTLAPNASMFTLLSSKYALRASKMPLSVSWKFAVVFAVKVEEGIVVGCALGTAQDMALCTVLGPIEGCAVELNVGSSVTVDEGEEDSRSVGSYVGRDDGMRVRSAYSLRVVGVDGCAVGTRVGSPVPSANSVDAAVGLADEFEVG